MIVGGGRIGYRLARRLEEKLLGCKLIEKQADRCEWLADRLERTVVLHGDGSDQSLLVEEGVADVDLVITDIIMPEKDGIEARFEIFVNANQTWLMVALYVILVAMAWGYRQVFTGRAALIHAVAHIELNAIDLAWDAVYRFRGLPPDYYGDWVRVAAEEPLRLLHQNDLATEARERLRQLTAHRATTQH